MILGISRSDVELIATLCVLVGNFFVQRRFFDFRSKDELIDDLTKTSKAKDQVIKGLKTQIEQLQFHRSVCKVKHN